MPIPSSVTGTIAWGQGLVSPYVEISTCPSGSHSVSAWWSRVTRMWATRSDHVRVDTAWRCPTHTAWHSPVTESGPDAAGVGVALPAR
jgi:hypothetical protein